MIVQEEKVVKRELTNEIKSEFIKLIVNGDIESVRSIGLEFLDQEINKIVIKPYNQNLIFLTV